MIAVERMLAVTVVLVGKGVLGLAGVVLSWGGLLGYLVACLSDVFGFVFAFVSALEGVLVFLKGALGLRRGAWSRRGAWLRFVFTGAIPVTLMLFCLF